MSGQAHQLSIVIVNWNTGHVLAGCLDSVFGTVNHRPFEVIVVDNDSSDGSRELIRSRFPQVKLLEPGANLGFAAGNNYALRQVSSDYVLLLNPDTIATPGAIDKLCEALEALPELGAVGAQLLNPDGSLQHSWGQFPFLEREVPLVRRFAQKPSSAKTAHYQDSEISLLMVDWAKGACLMIRREALEQVGLLDEEYWLYTEETDWCCRARAQGWEIAGRPDAHVYHIEQAASAQRLGPSFVNFTDSRILFVKKRQSKAAAIGVWTVFAARSLVWAAFPQRSHLGKHHGGYAEADVREAYLSFLRTWRDRALHRRPTAMRRST